MPTFTANAFTQAATPRIFCIGRNYANHIAELGHSDARTCVVFMKPLSALVAAGAKVPVPTDQGTVHHELELVLEIGTGGRNIRAENATSHIAGIGLGLDLTLRSLQNELKSTGEPWEKCKSFDYSAPLAPLRRFEASTDLGALEFQLDVNGECRQRGNTRMMLVDIPGLIVQLSAYWQLLPGDLIYTGTPEGVGAIKPGDTLAVGSASLPAAQWTVTASS